MKKYIYIAIMMIPALSQANDLSETIRAETRDKVDIERVSPPPVAEVKDVISFSRLGQTDYILSEELGYLDEEKQIALMDVRSPKTVQPSMITFPKPPFFLQPYPPAPKPIVVDKSENALPPRGQTESWTYIVIDQNNRLLKKVDGNMPPAQPIQWDGMKGDEFLLRPDEIYSSVLSIQETRGVTRTIVGEPVSFPAVRYNKGRNIIFEFSNKKTYADGGTVILPSIQVLVDQLMNELKKYEGQPVEFIIHSRDFDLSQRRAQMWKTILEKQLLKKADQFNVKVVMPGERGDITQVVLGIAR
jgi:hypothetical protein